MLDDKSDMHDRLFHSSPKSFRRKIMFSNTQVHIASGMCCIKDRATHGMQLQRIMLRKH